MSTNPSLSVLYSEIVLSLYPQLIKTVPTTLFTQTLARFLIFPLLALITGPFKDFLRAWGTRDEAIHSGLHGILNLTHVAASYYSFDKLPAGTATSLFYLYPIFNVIAGHFLFGETLTTTSIGIVLLGLVGAYLVATSYYVYAPSQDEKMASNRVSDETLEEKIKTESDKEGLHRLYHNDFKGVLAAIAGAITETMIYIFVKQSHPASAFYTVNHLYPSGLLLLLIYAGIKYITEEKTHPVKPILDTKKDSWLPLIIFNALLGFTGYMARFYGMPRIPVVLFASISFIGVIASYLWGALFQKQYPTIRGMIGASMIASSVALSRVM
jgi:drug/metabolite transporter (DMT)-like permease